LEFFLATFKPTHFGLEGLKKGLVNLPQIGGYYLKKATQKGFKFGKALPEVKKFAKKRLS